MTARVALTPMMSIYDGQQCIGFVIARARQGHEAFDRQERSLGHFKTAAQAANAVADAAQSETGAA